MSDQKNLLLSIFSYLRSLEKSSSIDSAVTLIETTLDVQNTPTNFSNASYYPLNLQEIFAAGVVALSAETPADALASVEGNTKFESFVNVVSKKGFFEGAEVGSIEYLQRQAKLVKKFKERQMNDVVSVAEAEKQAEEKKGLGNSAIVAKDYMGALAYYTEALEISADGPNSHIYHCNRAAAHCHLNNYIEAVEDCNASLALQPTYVKAFSRLGLANYFLERYEEAVSAYEEALVLEPDNKGTKASIAQAKGKIAELEKRSVLAGSSAGPPGGMGGMDMSALAGMMGGGGLPAGLDGMMNNPAMKEAMAKVGGADGLADLMKNPQMMAMAQKMMKDPKMIQEAMSLMGGKGGGGMPDVSALAGMMGAGGNGSSSSGRGGAREPFKGFADEDA